MVICDWQCHWGEIHRCSRSVNTFSTAVQENPLARTELLNRHCLAIKFDRDCIENEIADCIKNRSGYNKRLMELVKFLGDCQVVYYMCENIALFHQHSKCLLDPVVMGKMHGCSDDGRILEKNSKKSKICTDLLNNLNCIRETDNGSCHDAAAAELQYQATYRSLKPFMDLRSCSIILDNQKTNDKKAQREAQREAQQKASTMAGVYAGVIMVSVVSFAGLIVGCYMCVKKQCHSNEARNMNDLDEEGRSDRSDVETAWDSPHHVQSTARIPTVVTSGDVTELPLSCNNLEIGVPPPPYRESIITF